MEARTHEREAQHGHCLPLLMCPSVPGVDCVPAVAIVIVSASKVTVEQHGLFLIIAA